MKQTWNSFLQTVFQFVKSLFADMPKKLHRDALILTAGISVVTAVTFMAGDFQGGKGNALVAFAETPEETHGAETDLEEAGEEPSAAEEETEQETEQKEETPEETGSVSEGENSTEEDAGELKEAEGAEETEEAADSTEDAGEEEPDGSDENKESDAEEDEEDAIALSDRDYQVLLKIVQAEAGGCDQKGRILVANVILNRVESDEFPDTVSGVVYERHQFSPVSDGSINRCRVTEETVEAVECALAGEDYSEGALYFMNRRTAAGKNVRWFDNHLDYLFKHGNHEFFK